MALSRRHTLRVCLGLSPLKCARHPTPLLRFQLHESGSPGTIADGEARRIIGRLPKVERRERAVRGPALAMPRQGARGRELAAPVCDLEAPADPKVEDRQHVGAAEVEDEEHLGRPAPDALHGGERGDDLLVLQAGARAQRRQRAFRGGDPLRLFAVPPAASGQLVDLDQRDAGVIDTSDI